MITKIEEEREKEPGLKQNSLSKQTGFESIESKLLGPMADFRFMVDQIGIKKIGRTINQNLIRVNKNIFNPIESLKTLTNLKSGNVPHFSRFYKDLSTEEIDILSSPIEALFVTLSKMSWNKKLKWKKREQVRNTCLKISQLQVPCELNYEERHRDDQLMESHNLVCIRKIFYNLLDTLSVG